MCGSIRSANSTRNSSDNNNNNNDSTNAKNRIGGRAAAQKRIAVIEARARGEEEQQGRPQMQLLRLLLGPNWLRQGAGG
ncbi:unnamed protein product [Urochloa decumbens]|uniref:Uncharacterized protein n=1 Tax=Urochloa decumbens TaxID=240449 RepID=A0ABC8W5R0_9POAL